MSDNKLNWVVAIASSVAILLFAAYLTSANANRAFMNGELSIKHTLLQSDCEKCHKPWEGVSRSACLECHEGQKHYSKSASGKVAHDPADLDCHSCHREHMGKFQNIQLVEDSSCKNCHEWEAHPEIQRRELRVPPAGTILFGHQVHYENDVYGDKDCSMCHKDPNEGKPFAVMKFKDACGMCHMLADHSVEAENLESCPLCHLGNKYETPARDRLMASVSFSHENHAERQCAECHGDYITVSETGPADQPGEKWERPNVPEISKCADCHAENRVNSDCSTCHNYHIP